MDPFHRTGTLVIRVWLEEEFGAAALRARITQVLDVSVPVATTVAAASEDEILDAVRAWLHAFVPGGDISTTPGR
jgi:hypothetical protein